MDRDTKIELVENLTALIKSQVVDAIKSGKIPENWDGIELRWLVEKLATRQANYPEIGKKRRRAFVNTVLVENL